MTVPLVSPLRPSQGSRWVWLCSKNVKGKLKYVKITEKTWTCWEPAHERTPSGGLWAVPRARSRRGFLWDSCGWSWHGARSRTKCWDQVVAGGLSPVSGWTAQSLKAKARAAPLARRGCGRPGGEGGSADRLHLKDECRQLQLNRELSPEWLPLGLSQLQLLQGRTLEKAGL